MLWQRVIIAAGGFSISVISPFWKYYLKVLMSRLQAFALLMFGHCVTGFLVFLILVFAGAASAGAESFRTTVLPIGIGIAVFLIVISLALLFCDKHLSAVAVAWAVPTLVIGIPQMFSVVGALGSMIFGHH